MAIGNDWEMKDLRYKYDEDLFMRFYQLIEANFPLEEEREQIETWRQALADNNITNTFLSPAETHILIPLSRTFSDHSTIGGGLVFEYHPKTNCGMLTYLVVDEVCRGQGMGRKLVEKAVQILNETAKQRGHSNGCNGVFLETNSPSKFDIQNDVMSPRDRQIVYIKLGFQIVDINYIAPPLGPHKTKMDFLTLMVLITPQIPLSPKPRTKEKEYYLPSTILKSFLWGLWQQSYERKYLPCPPNNDADYQNLIHEIDETKDIPLLNVT